MNTTTASPIAVLLGTLPAANTVTVGMHLDFCTRLEYRRRVRELEELAQAEGLRLPMPAAWIAVLEGCGYTVDLATGKWTDASGAQFWPTEAAYNLLEGVQP